MLCFVVQSSGVAYGWLSQHMSQNRCSRAPMEHKSRTSCSNRGRPAKEVRLVRLQGEPDLDDLGGESVLRTRECLHEPLTAQKKQWPTAGHSHPATRMSGVSLCSTKVLNVDISFMQDWIHKDSGITISSASSSWTIDSATKAWRLKDAPPLFTMGNLTKGSALMSGQTGARGTAKHSKFGKPGRSCEKRSRVLEFRLVSLTGAA